MTAMFDEDARDLAIRQFGQERGSDADLQGHRSVWRGDPDADRPQRRAEFEQHLSYCGVCPDLEAQDARSAAPDEDTDEA